LWSGLWGIRVETSGEDADHAWPPPVGFEEPTTPPAPSTPMQRRRVGQDTSLYDRIEIGWRHDRADPAGAVEIESSRPDETRHSGDAVSAQLTRAKSEKSGSGADHVNPAVEEPSAIAVTEHDAASAASAIATDSRLLIIAPASPSQAGC
jgi:hypothetical protein